jgi:hypothetical protein
VKKVVPIFVLLVVAAIATWSWVRSSARPESPVVTATDQAKAPTSLPKSKPPEPAAPVTKADARPPTPAARTAVVLQKPPGQMTINDVVLPGNRISDPKFGLSATYPADWTVRDVALRWGVNEGENTIFFGPPEGSQAVPSLYYRRYSDGPAFSMANPEATLRDMARQKEESRSGGGKNDYKNDPESFVFRTIDGNPSLSYFATYTRGGEVHAEYFLRILGPSGYVMFFNQGPVKDVQTLIPTILNMGGTVKPP